MLVVLISGDVSYMKNEAFVHQNEPLFDEVLLKPFSYVQLKKVMETLNLIES